MKITQVICQILRIPNIVAKTASSQDSVLVRVRTDDGLEGVGEADSSPEGVKAIIDAPFSHNIACGLRQLLVGENPLDHERLWQKMYRKTMYFGRKALGITAMAAVDMALWDLKGKAFNQPIHRLLGGKQHDRVRGYAWLRDRSPIPIAAGEGECGRESFRPLIDRRALDVYQVDISRCGFTDAAYIRARVEEIGARLCNHCYTSPLTVAASIHWLSTCRDAFLFEDCVEDSPLRHNLTIEKVQSVDGWIEVPDRPGLGITLNEEFIKRYLVAESGR